MSNDNDLTRFEMLIGLVALLGLGAIIWKVFVG
jgi:hypothetical protein